MPQLNTKRFGLLVAVFLVVLAPAAQVRATNAAGDGKNAAKGLPGPPGYQGVEPDGEYEIDIERRAFREKLPIDVDFFVRGPIPGEAGEEVYQEVSGKYAGFKKSPNCDRYFRGLEIVVNRPGKSKPGKTLEPVETEDLGPAVIIRKGKDPAAALAAATKAAEAAKVAGASDAAKLAAAAVAKVAADAAVEASLAAIRTSDQFLLPVPPLKPNRYYCFEFTYVKRLGQDELQALKPKFTRALEAEFQRPAYVGKVNIDAALTEFQSLDRTTVNVRTVAQYENIRKELILQLEEELARGQVLRAPEGTFFDADTSFSGIDENSRVKFDDILRAQQQKFENIKTLETQAAELVDLYLKVLREGKFELKKAENGKKRRATLAELLKNPPDRSETVADELKNLRVDLVAVLGSTNEQFKNLVKGLPAAGGSGLDDVWAADDADLTSRMKNVKQLAAAIPKLKELAVLVGIDPEVAPVPTNPNGDKLEKLVSEAADRIGDFGQLLTLQDLQQSLENRSAAIAAVVETLFVEVQEKLRVGGSSVADYATRSTWYMSADVGGAYAWDTEQIFSYLGLNMYFRPVNKQAHLGGNPFGNWDEFKKRFSVTFGLAWSGVEETENPVRFKGVVAGRAAILGVGMRLNDAVRFSLGGLVFENQDPNPLLTTTSLEWTPYVAFSIDWNVAKTGSTALSPFLKN